MKKVKIFAFLISAFLLSLFAGCSKEVPLDNEMKFTQDDTVIDGNKLNNSWAFITYDLSAFSNQKVTIDFSAEMKVENTGSKSKELMWQVNINSYPVIASHVFEPGTSEWVKVTGKNEDPISLGSNNLLYLSTNNESTSEYKIYLRNIEYTVNYQKGKIIQENGPYWCDDSVQSFKDAYKEYFDYVGFAATGDELTNTEIQKGLRKHANTTTMGNEFKPDFIFVWQLSASTPTKDFVASNGKTIKVPSSIPNFSSQDRYLQICKENGLKMRGHVLTWHSQTPEAFFKENYDTSKSFVNTATMEARQEWYIKTVLEHIEKWEKDNNNGEHIIWAWDVVNEAVNDGNSGSLRTESNWYKIYKNDEFIVNAFRYANKYAPTDVLLCYNDYNCLESAKRSGMLTLLRSIISHQNDSELPTRIDVMGMQSHLNKYASTSTFAVAVKDFTNLGLDVHVTELDIGTEENYDPEELASVYKNFFKMFINNRKTASKKGISSITIWGINDETTWLNSASQIQWHGNVTQYPLLFAKNTKGQFVCKKAFDSVIEAAKEYKN